MSVQLPSEVEEVLYRGFRDLRDLGHQSPGISFERDAMQELGLLDDDGVPEDHQVRMTILEDGRVLLDLQVNESDRIHV